MTHQLIEGCLITCYALGLSQCFLYVRGEMPAAQENLAQALNEAYAKGYVGKNIMGTEFSVDITLTWGAGAYIVGEETALIESLEGNRGMPRLPPFFPAAIGLYGQPTIVNNVETLSNLPWLLVNGAEQYKAFGSEASPGSRMVAVSGHESSRVYEIEQGVTTFRDLFYGDNFCAGSATTTNSRCSCPAAGRPLVLPGATRPSLEGRTVGAEGSMLGSGAIMVMDETTDAVKAALRLVRFYARESCGKCTPCGRAPPGRSASCSAFSTVRVGPATSTSCSTSPTTSRPAPTRSQPTVPGPRRRAVPAEADHHLPAGLVVGRPDHVDDSSLPSRVRGQDHQAGFHPGDGRPDVV